MSSSHIKSPISQTKPCILEIQKLGNLVIQPQTVFTAKVFIFVAIQTEQLHFTPRKKS